MAIKVTKRLFFLVAFFFNISGPDSSAQKITTDRATSSYGWLAISLIVMIPFAIWFGQPFLKNYFKKKKGYGER